MKKDLLSYAHSLPKSPGCYLFKNKSGVIIYVGKAKSLKSRVSSYFTDAKKTPKTEVLVGHIREIDFLLAENESAAFVIENNLIKKYRPRYNVMLKDDKTYPYVVISYDEPFPRLEYQRNPKRKGKKEIYGPFVVGSNLSQVLKILTKSFELRDCTLKEFESRKQPCLLYQMKQCSAPCVQKILVEDYEKDLNLALNLFKGKGRKTLSTLKKRMESASKNEEYERAAIIRDGIITLEGFLNFQHELAESNKGQGDKDFVGFYLGEQEVDICIYMMRNGMILGHKNFHFPTIDATVDLEEHILNYLLQYYSTTSESLPKDLILPFKKEQIELMQFALNESIEEKIKISKVAPSTKGFIGLTEENAENTQRVRLANQDSVYVGLNKLADLLNLEERPQVLECYDVAVFQGSSPTAAQIVFVDGRPVKNQYRHYHLKELPEGNNDFAMMKELLARRVKHGNLPDVFIIDGGVGQVNTVKKVLQEAEIDLPVIGIAKSKTLSHSKKFQRKDVEKSDERLVIPGRANPYILSKNPSLFKIIVQMRDEAHRFSRRLHHKQENKRVLNSWVDEIYGIGRITRNEILKSLVHSPQELADMNLTQISRSLGVNIPVARKIKNYLKRKFN